MPRLMGMLLVGVLLSGCATAQTRYEVKQWHRFYDVYANGNYTQMIGMTMTEAVAFMNYGPDHYVVDSYGDGWITFSPGALESCSPRLQLLIKNCKVVDVVKWSI